MIGEKSVMAEEMKKTASEKLVEETKATNEKRKRSNRTPIITVDGQVKVSTASDRNKEALITLTESKKASKILTGTIDGIEKLKKTSVAVIFMEDFKIIIPATDCIDNIGTPSKDSNFTQEQHEEYVISKRIGSQIDYIVMGIDKENSVVVASRKKAMDKKKEQMLMGKRKNGEYIINEGALVQARIVCTVRAGIIVEIFGVEVYIKASELSYQRIQDATEEFEVGDCVLVKILSITREDGEVYIDASVKQADENPAKKALKRYNEQYKYIGTVSLVDEHGIFVRLSGGIDVLCHFPDRGERPVRNAKVTVRILKKDEEQGRLFGKIIHVSAN